MKNVTFLDSTEQVLDGIEKNVAAALAGSGIVLQGNIMTEAPVKTGKLAGSISMKSDRREAEVSTNVEYAPRIEYGFKGEDVSGRTFNQGPNPFFRRGAEASKEPISNVFKHYLKKEIKVTGGKEKKI